MSRKFEAEPALPGQLSAFVDGELDAGAVVAVCGACRDDAQALATWHLYHLVGDILRSDDLATEPARDAAFLAALRIRMAREPVVFAPPAASPRAAGAAPGVREVHRAGGRRWGWLAPSAVAAGFVAVAGVYALIDGRRAPEPVGTVLAGRPGAVGLDGAGAAPRGIAAADAGVITGIGSGELVRDARIDAYLAAHKQFAGSSALGVPPAFLRNATLDVSGR